MAVLCDRLCLVSGTGVTPACDQGRLTLIRNCRGPVAHWPQGGDEDTMAGMKVTLSAAMRARDVSRPHDEHEAAAEEAGARAAAPGAAGPPPRSRTAGNPGGEQPAAGARPREDTGGQPIAIPKNAGGRPRRKRR